MQDLKHFIDDIPDFPDKGVMFRDITPLLERHFEQSIESLKSLFSQQELNDVDCFAGLDARGFIFASAMAAKLSKNLVVIRKAGKLPPPVQSESYTLEYGCSTMEMKSGTGKVIIVDDVIATGGSMTAAANLCEKAGYNILAMACLIDLTYLNNFKWNDHTVRSVVQYHE